jgi:hypothetical protein
VAKCDIDGQRVINKEIVANSHHRAIVLLISIRTSQTPGMEYLESVSGTLIDVMPVVPFKPRHRVPKQVIGLVDSILSTATTIP